MLEIWHNPRCSKSRETLAIIEAAGVAHRVRRYLDDPPDVAELDRVLRALGVEPWEMARLGEAVADDLELRARERSRPEWLDAMVENPILIERPVVIRDDGKAIVGRPPKNVAALL